MPCAIMMQEEKLAAARTLENPFGTFQFEIVELDHIAQRELPKKRLAD